MSLFEFIGFLFNKSRPAFQQLGCGCISDLNQRTCAAYLTKTHSETEGIGKEFLDLIDFF